MDFTFSAPLTEGNTFFIYYGLLDTSIIEDSFTK